MTSSTLTAEPNKKAFYLLMATEFWERFSYYSMQFLLVLYASATIAHGGLGWSKVMALQLTGIYGALSFALPIFGGLLVDKQLGQKIAALIGAAQWQRSVYHRGLSTGHQGRRQDGQGLTDVACGRTLYGHGTRHHERQARHGI